MSDDDYYADFDDLHSCPNCGGGGYVNCHCGGDLCVCDNHGDAPCPTCFGEGEVTEARYDRYMENLRKQRELLAALQSTAETQTP